MDWNPNQDEDFSSLLDYTIELGLFMDQAPSDDNRIDELMALPCNYSSPFMDLPAPIHDVGADAEESILQLSLSHLEKHQLMTSTNNIFEYGYIDSAVETISENDTTQTIDTPSSAWTSNNEGPPLLDQLPSMPPFNHSNCQASDAPLFSLDQSEYFASPVPMAPTHQQVTSIQHTTVTQPPRRRRRKNPEDLKKNQRKASKPEECIVCKKGHTQYRDLERHMVSNHRLVAEILGMDVSKIKCPIINCGSEFDNIRRDRLVRHKKRIHGISH